MTIGETITIGDLGAFFTQVEPRHRALLESSAPWSLEVALAPGAYEGMALTLHEPEGAARGRLVLRASDPSRPPVLRDMHLSLGAAQVELRDLVFAGGRSGGPRITLEVQERATIAGCCLAAIDLDEWPPGQPIVLVRAAPGRSPTEVAVEHSWWIGNELRGPALLALDAAPPHRFARLRLEGVTLIANTAPCAVAPGPTESVLVRNCLSVPGKGRASLEALVALSYLETGLRIEASTIIAPDIGALVRHHASPTRTPAEFKPARISNSRLVLADTSDPPAAHGLTLAATAVEPATGLRERQARWAELARDWATAAGRGALPPLDVARSAIEGH